MQSHQKTRIIQLNIDDSSQLKKNDNISR